MIESLVIFSKLNLNLKRASAVITAQKPLWNFKQICHLLPEIKFRINFLFKVKTEGYRRRGGRT